MVAGERLVQRPHKLGDPRVIGSNDYAVRAHEVVDRGAFLQEFRIGDDVEFERKTAS